MPIPRQLLPAPANFTDRMGELATLRQLLDDLEAANSSKLVVLTGIGGIGKTSLALFWLHEIRNRFSAGQLYADLGGFSLDGPASPRVVLGGFLRSLGVAPEQMPDELSERAGLYRSLTDGKPIIVMLDNAASAAQVRVLLPGAGPNLVVVTTRRFIAGLTIDGARCVEVAPLWSSVAGYRSHSVPWARGWRPGRGGPSSGW
jgi:hypothetical protein